MAWIDSAKTITVSLQPAATLAGDVRTDGPLLVEGYARLTSSTNDSMNVNLKETQGHFQFDELPAGQMQLDVLNDRGQTLQSDIIYARSRTRAN